MDFALSEQQRAFQDVARGFAAEQLAPHAALWDEQCHFPIAFEGSCRACHFEEPQHETAPDQPDWHVPGMNCRGCHTPTGNGAPPLRHVDNGTQCETCHR